MPDPITTLTPQTPSTVPPTTVEPETQPTITEPPKKVEPDVIDKEKYDLVLRESMGRKGKIQELEAQLERFNTLTPEGKTVEEQLKSFQDQLSGLTVENSKLKHLSEVRDVMDKLGAVDPRVAELAYADADSKGVIGSSSELLSGYLEQWKSDNKSLFKAESPVTTPLPSQQPQIQVPPTEMTPDDEVKKYLEMPREERAKINPRELARFVKMHSAQTAAKMRGTA